MIGKKVLSGSRKIRVGLIGAGYVSAYHIQAIRSLECAEIVAIADVDLQRARMVASRFGIPMAVAELAEMERVQPEVIHVLTPIGLHAELAIQALEMGCHVFVEKPMAETAADCDRMMAAARHAGRVLSVNHSARMDPAVLEGLELAHKGAIGEVLAVDFFRSSNYPPYRGGPLPPHYRQGSFPFRDLGVHGLSLFEVFLGKLQSLELQPRSSGRSANLLFDEWRAWGQCERGLGQMYLSWNVRPIRSELHVHGTEGIIQVDRYLQTCTLRRTLPGLMVSGVVVGTFVSTAKILWQIPINALRFASGRLRGSPGIGISIRQFYESLLQRTPPPIPAEEGRRLVAFMEEPCRQADQKWELWRKASVETPLAPARVLVTGAGGFLGRALVQRLSQYGETIRAHFRRSAPALSTEGTVQPVYGDLGDPEVVDHAVRGVDIVYHVGATVRGGAIDFERGTVWGTRNVVDACLKHKVKRLVYVSSLSVLDHARHRAGQRVDEGWAYEPYPRQRGAYTQAKLEAEKLVRKAIRERHLPAIILRPGQILGPGATPAPAGTKSLAGRCIVPGNGKVPLPLVYVHDVVSALVLAADRGDLVGKIFHIVDKQTMTQREYINACRRALPADIRALYVPRWLLYATGFACELLGAVLHCNLPLSRYRVRSLRPLSSLDISAATEKLRWSPEVGVHQGLTPSFRSDPSVQR